MKDNKALTNEVVSVNLIRAELDTAIAFITDALHSESESVRTPENVHRARSIYDKTILFLANTTLTQAEEIAVVEQLFALRSSLQELGENI